MADISTQGAKDGKLERRAGERRSGQRRKASGTAGHYKGTERRAADTDRRATLVNRLNRVVTDRRS